MPESRVCTYFPFSFPTTMILQLTEATLFHWNSAFEFLNHRDGDLKEDYSGLRSATRIQNWVATLSTGMSHRTTDSSLASSHNLHTTDPSSNFSASSRSQAPVTPVRSSSDGLGYRISNFEASDGLYRDALMNLPMHPRRDPSVVSDNTRSMWCRPFTH